MRIIERYLLGRFLSTFCVFFITFVGLYVVIDAFGNLEEFIKLGQREGSLVGVLFDYYGARAVTLFDRTSGILTLIAAMFTVTSIERNNEMTALMAAGVSKFRIVKPLIIAVVVVSFLAAANREFTIPKIRHKLTQNAQDLLGSSAKKLSGIWDNQTDIFLSGRSTLAADKQIIQPSFQLPPQFPDFGPQIVAANAFYQAPEDDRPGGYWMKEVEQPKEINQLKSASLDGRPVLLTPADTSWLGPQECFVVSDISFQQLTGGSSWRQYSSTSTLIAGLHNPSLGFGGDVRVAVHSRLVRPFLDIVLLFLGLPLILARENRNIFLAIGLCVLVTTGFFAITLTCQSLGANMLISPALAAWCPLMIFVPFAVIFSEPLRG